MAIIELLIVITIFLFSVVFHEVAHGWVAFALGDSTAKRAGRLTLNPLKHLDPIGSVLLPGFLVLMKLAGMGGFIFGWAKPVPINPYNFKDQKYGSAKVAAAGPIANFSLALIFGLALRFFPIIYSISGVGLVFLYIVQINLILAVFNLLPIPPLDGSHILFVFLGRRAVALKMFLVKYGFFLLVFLIVFFFQYIAQVVLWLMKFITGIPI